MDRRTKLLSGLDLARQQGAEIGALASPLVSRADGPVVYIDHADTDTLKRKYASDPTIDIDAIVNVDAIWGENTIQEALGENKKLDYIVASHVVEHVPDLVSWLQELNSVLKPGGAIRLAVPDKRFCFDYLRQETQLSNVLAAYYNRARQPQVREVIDSELYHLHVSASAAWRGELDTDPLLQPEQLNRAFSVADQAKNGGYVDVHCWVFTLASFACIMQQLGSLGLTSLACSQCYDTEINAHEFIVIMSPADQAEVVGSWGRVRQEAKAFPSEHMETWPEARRRWLERGCNSCDADDKAEIALLKQQVIDLRNSTSWRITSLLRILARRLGRR